MYRFQVTLHPAPATAQAGPEWSVDGTRWPTLDVDEPARTATFSRDYEAVARDLAALPRLFWEPDGAFVWVADAPDKTWQVDGVAYERDGQLWYLELAGQLPGEALDRLLTAVGWPEQGLIFQVTRAAAFLDEATFRRWAEGD